MFTSYKFVRIYEEKLLKDLLENIDDSLDPSFYKLGLPMNNLENNKDYYNTSIIISNRNLSDRPIEHKVYYNRKSIKTIEDKLKNITFKEKYFIYDLLNIINKRLEHQLNINDIYNTSLKEENGKYYFYLISKPESYKFTDSIRIEVFPFDGIELHLNAYLKHLNDPMELKLIPKVITP